MISSIIRPMKFSIIRDMICQHLKDERDNQKTLAQENGATAEWIAQNIHFTIFPKRFRYPDVEEMPCVYVYFNKTNFPADEQDVQEYEANSTLNVEYYAVGLNDSERDADTNASDRLEYLTAQIFNMLCSEQADLYTATGKLIKRLTLNTWERIISPEAVNTAGTILGAKFTFDVEYSEPTAYAQTNELEEIVVNSIIKDENINPLLKYIFKNENKGE